MNQRDSIISQKTPKYTIPKNIKARQTQIEKEKWTQNPNFNKEAICNLYPVIFLLDFTGYVKNPSC